MGFYLGVGELSSEAEASSFAMSGLLVGLNNVSLDELARAAARTRHAGSLTSSVSIENGLTEA